MSIAMENLWTETDAQELADGIGGTWWAYNPMTDTYQKYFAEEFGMDYEKDPASLGSTYEKIRAMHDVLMSSDKDRDSITGVDDYTYIRRESIVKLNKEADLNKRTRLAWYSDFTDPSGTDPSEAVGSEGELLYAGEDPEKTGGFMRIEKTPDPSAIYHYSKDGVPWNEPDSSVASPLYPYYDETYKDSMDRFVRLPDHHTIWGSRKRHI